MTKPYVLLIVIHMAIRANRKEIGAGFEPKSLIHKFDVFLHSKGLRFEAVIVGSGAMVILNLIHRYTVDVDVLSPPIDKSILQAAQDFRFYMKKKGVHLTRNWLNNGPANLTKHLPKGWEKRMQNLYQGKAITFKTLGRVDLIKDKLWGLCDLRHQDELVLLNLKPTKNELNKAAQWAKKQEAHPHWPQHVDRVVVDLLKKINLNNKG